MALSCLSSTQVFKDEFFSHGVFRDPYPLIFKNFSLTVLLG